MFVLHCPHCAEKREEEEFGYGGEAFIARPSGYTSPNLTVKSGSVADDDMYWLQVSGPVTSRSSLSGSLL